MKPNFLLPAVPAALVSAALACAVLLGGCAEDDTTQAMLGGTVTGLSAGTAVALDDNGVKALAVTGSGAYELPTALPAGTSYSITVDSQPPGLNCSVANGTGTVDANGDPVQDINVVCVPSSTVGGTVSGLPAGAQLVLSDGNNTLSIAQAGAYVFPDTYVAGASYAVSVLSASSGLVCGVSNGSGSIDAAGDAVNNVAVSCAPQAALGGTVTGLAPNATLVLSDGISSVAVSANGVFGFADAYGGGAIYQVSIAAQPTGQVCVLSNAGGAFDSNADPVSNIGVSCASNGSLNGSVGGLAAGGTLVLSDGLSTLTVTANGSFAFSDVFGAGAGYALSVISAPVGEVCTLSSGSGIFDAAADPVNVTVSCS